MEQDTSQERSKYSRDVQRLQGEKEELEAEVMRAEVEAKYHRGRTANHAGFTTGSQKRSGSVNSGTSSQRSTNHSGDVNNSTPLQRSADDRNQSNTSIRRHRPNMNQQQTYAVNEQMRAHFTWLVCNDTQETWVSGFILAAKDDVQVIELIQDEWGTTQCQFKEYKQSEFATELQSGVLSAQTEADLVLCEEATPVSTLDEMEELKSVCRAWIDSDDAQYSGFRGKEYKELRRYIENEAIVHDICSGDIVYVRERIQSLTHRNPGIMQEDGTVFLIHLENSPRNVEPKEVFHLVSECSTECGSATFNKSMSRALSSSRSSTKTDTKVYSKPGGSKQHIDQITLQKHWNALMYASAPSSEWTKMSLAVANSTNKQGKHFGLMRNIYANLMAQKQNEEYVLYMVNQMTACNHVAQTTIDTFEKEANGTILRTKNQRTIQDAIDELFLGITGQDMASLGLQAHRVEWDLLTSATSWRAGDAETKLRRELEVVNQNMANGKIAEYKDCIMYIDPIIQRSGLPKEFFTVTKKMWEAQFAKFKDSKQLFLEKVRHDLNELMEGAHGQSIFAKWNRFLTRHAKGKIDTIKANIDDEETLTWIEESKQGIWIEESNQATWKSTPTQKPALAQKRSHRQGNNRLVNNISDTPQEEVGQVNVFRSLPDANELSQIAYTPKEEAMEHADDKCEFHKQVIINTNSFKNGDRTVEDVLETLHMTKECLAYQQPHLNCTAHQGGKAAIIHIYQTDDPVESKRRWTEAAAHIRSQTEDNGGKLNCIWHDEEEGFLFHIIGGSAALKSYANSQGAERRV